MGFFESLFYTIWRGIAIGILISAPMGPVGILCIQRTLYKGRKTGLYTGIGAAISDLFYCILTGFGLSFIEEFLERNQNIIQLAGSAVLIAFAIYLFKKNPASSLKTPQEENQQISPHKNILGGFLFTFSNPLILFLIIGLFARFNFSIPEISFYYYIAGYVAIFVGAVIWWEFVTFSVNKLRAHFNLRSMWLINRIIGVIILLFAVVGIVTGITNLASAHTTSWNKGRGYLPFKYATSEGILIDNPTDSVIYDCYTIERASDIKLKFRASNLHSAKTGKYSYISEDGELFIHNPFWGLYIAGDTDTLAVRIRGVEFQETIESVQKLEFACISNNDTPAIHHVKDGFSTYNEENLWTLEVKDGILRLSGGNRGQIEVFTHPFKTSVTDIGFLAGSGGRILISDITLEYPERDPGNKNFPNKESIREYLLASNDPMEGYWVVFDRDLEEDLLKMGGKYTFACVKSDNGYKMLYYEGGQVNSGSWSPGEVKIELHPTAFDGIYDVTWYDAMKEKLDNELKAQAGDGNTLVIQFPYQTSKLRLRKLPSDSSATSTGTASAKTTSETATSTASAL